MYSHSACCLSMFGTRRAVWVAPIGLERSSSRVVCRADWVRLAWSWGIATLPQSSAAVR